jgi:iron-sulfur cluster assembly protein
MDINITDRALGRIRETAQQEGVTFTDTVLRIGVVAGGCSGLSYDLGWDTVTQPKDQLIEIDGVRVAMDLKSFLYLEGTTLDFTEGLEGKGFYFDNPQAARTCACGDSFAV